MVAPKIIAVIPARGGSKRILKKNIKPFKGKPMIAWTIDAAREAGVFDQILVSTDDQEIADISKQYGAECPFLRQESFDDITPRKCGHASCGGASRGTLWRFIRYRGAAYAELPYSRSCNNQGDAR